MIGGWHNLLPHLENPNSLLGSEVVKPAAKNWVMRWVHPQMTVTNQLGGSTPFSAPWAPGYFRVTEKMVPVVPLQFYHRSKTLLEPPFGPPAP